MIRQIDNGLCDTALIIHKHSLILNGQHSGLFAVGILLLAARVDDAHIHGARKPLFVVRTAVCELDRLPALKSGPAS